MPESHACRRTRGGQPEIERVLFMAAMTAVKHDPKHRSFYERLLARGKKPLVALTAVTRKLIVTCNAVLKPCLNPTTTRTQAGRP